MKRILLTFVFALSAFQLFAQQDAMFSQYFFNPLVINPAYAGSREVLSFVGVARQQWVGIKDAPATQTATIHGLVKKKRIGLGLHLFHDQVGPLNQTGLITSYAYRINFDHGVFAMGIQAAIYQIGIRWNEIHVEVPTDGSFSNPIENKFHPDVNFGMYYYTDRFYAGLSLSHLIQNDLGLTPEYERFEAAQILRHYFATAGYVIPMSENINFRPSTLIKYVQGAPLDFDFNASFLFNETVWAGLGVRTSKKSGVSKYDNQLLFVMEYIINNKVRLGYSYDHMLNQLGSEGASSHEVMIGFDLNVYRTKMLTPRYF